MQLQHLVELIVVRADDGGDVGDVGVGGVGGVGGGVAARARARA